MPRTGSAALVAAPLRLTHLQRSSHERMLALLAARGSVQQRTTAHPLSECVDASCSPLGAAWSSRKRPRRGCGVASVARARSATRRPRTPASIRGEARCPMCGPRSGTRTCWTGLPSRSSAQRIKPGERSAAPRATRAARSVAHERDLRRKAHGVCFSPKSSSSGGGGMAMHAAHRKRLPATR